MSLFVDIGIIVIVAAVLAFLARLLHQPIIVGYMIAGLAIGPSALGLVKDQGAVAALSELGVAFLLFLVGLELEVTKVRKLGKAPILAGIGQVGFTFIAGWFLARWLGFPAPVATVISTALTMSSTIVVVKLLTDKQELHTLHGHLALGILLIQDFIAVLALGAMSSGAGTATQMATSAAVGIGLFVAAILLGKFVLGFPFRFLAKNTEALFIAAIAWCFAFAIAAAAFKFSLAIGAFLAGLSLAALPYKLEIVGKIRPLRDFFATLFFVSLGMQIPLASLGATGFAIAAFSLFVLIGNPLIVVPIIALLGFRARTAFLTGTAIAQVSEFSLILTQVARDAGMVGDDVVGIIAAVAVITFAVSAYLITNNTTIYRKLEPALKPLEKLAYRIRHEERDPAVEVVAPNVLIFGCNRMGKCLLQAVRKQGEVPLVVDYNPDVIRRLQREGILCLYGDVSEHETLRHLPFRDVDTIVSTVTGLDDNLMVIRAARRARTQAHIIVTAERDSEAQMLYDAGADYVILPRRLSAGHVSHLLSHPGLMNVERAQQLHELEEAAKDAPQ